MIEILRHPLKAYEEWRVKVSKKVILAIFFASSLVSALVPDVRVELIESIYVCIGVLIVVAFLSFCSYMVSPYILKWSSYCVFAKGRPDIQQLKRALAYPLIPVIVFAPIAIGFDVFGSEFISGLIYAATNIWSLAIAVLIYQKIFSIGKIRAFVLHYFPLIASFGVTSLIIEFVVALYVIPTGTMQPTLRGANDYGVGDTVLVNKLAYLTEKPKRWELGVFKTPFLSFCCEDCGTELSRGDELTSFTETMDCFQCRATKPVMKEQRSYVKRVIGLPNEFVKIMDGDVFINREQEWQRLKKPFDVFRQSSKLVGSWRTSPKEFNEGYQAEGKGQSTEVGKDMVIKDEEWAYSNQISGLGDKPSQKESGQRFSINGDISLGLSVKEWPVSGKVVISLVRDYIPFVMKVNLDDKKWSLSVKGETLLERVFSEVDICHVYMLDGDFGCLWGEKPHQVDVGKYLSGQTVSIKPAISVDGELVLSDLEIMKDVYYSPVRTSDLNEYRMGNFEYFMLGDNSFFSSDSRDFGMVNMELMIGKVELLLFPTKRFKIFH